MRKSFFYVCCCAILFSACQHKNTGKGFSYHPDGYYFQLLSFDSDEPVYAPDRVVWLSASFRTQKDSVFWDSDNNLNDCFYMACDTTRQQTILKNYLSICSRLDSACVLIKTGDFFQQQFKTAAIPFFCTGDSVVKVSFKIKQVYSPIEFINIKHNLKKKEEEQIESYFGSVNKLESAADPSGFYWLERSLNYTGDIPKPGDMVTIAYEGAYLNGRFLEKSGKDFEFIYGTPDQLLKGLNYVIGRLKLGENAKIILPSRLAFGENGSSNGTVPPYTPLVYEIRVINIKSVEKKS